MAERKVAYQTFQHQADSGFVVTAPSLERLYIDAALSLTDQLSRLERIECRDRKTIQISGESREDLMRCWLNEVLQLFERDQFLSHRIVFNQFDGKRLQATLWGELYQPLRHGHVIQPKAVDSHQIEMGDKEIPEPHFFAKVRLSSK